MPPYVEAPISILAAGSNGHGQLAISSTEDAHVFRPCLFAIESNSRPTLPMGVTSIVNVAAGANHTLLLIETQDNDRQLWVCGDNGAGQLDIDAIENAAVRAGDRTLFRRAYIQQLSASSSVSHIAAAWESSYIAVSVGSSSDYILSFGSNAFGTLGVYSPNKRNGTVTFDHLLRDDEYECYIRIGSITSGPRHILVLLQVVQPNNAIRSVVAGWGACRHGQLGPRTEKGQDGRPVPFLQEPVVVPLDVSDQDPVISMAAGFQHSLFLHASGRVSALGADRHGQVTAPRTWENVKAIACTWNGSYAIASEDGTWSVLAAGTNVHGQLGNEDVACLKYTHDLTSCTSNSSETKLSCGSEHILLLLSFGDEPRSKTLCWGWNEHGNLGLGHTEDVWSPVNISTGRAAASEVVGVWAGCGTTFVAYRALDNKDSKI
jgi:protein ATS1